MSEIVELTQQWTRAVERGDAPAAHVLVHRAITAPRLRTKGLTALVDACEQHADKMRMVAALLRQLCSGSANSRGGLHARKYPLVLGLQMKTEHSTLDEEYNFIHRYWLELLKRERIHVGEVVHKVPLLPSVRYLVDTLLAPAHPDLVPQYSAWLNEQGLNRLMDDNVGAALGCASVQTLWVTAQGNATQRDEHLFGSGGATFLEATASTVQRTWYAAVDYFLERWHTDSPEKLAVKWSARQNTPWVPTSEVPTLRKTLQNLVTVRQPLEPFAAWQRQQLFGQLHDVVDGTCYIARSSGIVSVTPTKSGVLAVAWLTTPKPTNEELASELWQGSKGSVESGADSVLPEATQHALWQALQQENDHQGEFWPTGSTEDEMLVVGRSFDHIDVPWTEESKAWAKDWLLALPSTIKTWLPEVSVLRTPDGLGCPTPPRALVQQTAYLEDPLATDSPIRVCSLEEAMWGEAGQTLMRSAEGWSYRLTDQFREPVEGTDNLYNYGLVSAWERGIRQWTQQSFTRQGRMVIGGWVRKHSPRAIGEVCLAAGRMKDLPADDARALAQWLRSTPMSYLFRQDFVWTLSAALNPSVVHLVVLKRELLDAIALADAKSLTVRNVLETGEWVYFDVDDPWALPDVPDVRGYGTESSYRICGVHLWSRSDVDNRVEVSLALNLRHTFTLDPGPELPDTTVRADKYRVRTVDTYESFRLPAVPPTLSLTDWIDVLIAEMAATGPAPGEYQLHSVAVLKSVLVLLGTVGAQLQAGDIAREPLAYSADGAESNAVDLEDVFRSSRPAGDETPLTGWVLTKKCASDPVFSGNASLKLSESHRVRLGSILRAAREAQGVSAKEVARKVFGLRAAHASVCRIERGVVGAIPIRKLVQLLTHYGLTLEQALATARGEGPEAAPAQP